MNDTRYVMTSGPKVPLGGQLMGQISNEAKAKMLIFSLLFSRSQL